MKICLSDTILPGLVAVAGTVLLALWIGTRAPSDLQARVPGMDQPPTAALPPRDAPPPPVAGHPVTGEGVASEVPGQWPGFRGPNRDAVCDDGTSLARAWPPEGPPALWSIELGEGYASAAIGDGRVYVLDYDEQAEADTMRCLSLDDGREIWRNSYPVQVTRNHGMSRTVPALVGDYVISLGPRCHVACWDARTGSCQWLIDLVGQHGATVPRWYAGQCPLVDQERLILAPGGPSLLVAIDYRTGEVIWESPNPRGWEMTHSSVMPMDFAGRRSYVYCASGGVAGVAADDGSLLWHSTEWTAHFANSPSPLVLPDGRIFFCSGYGNTMGSLMMQLRVAEEQIVAETLFQLPPKRFNSEQQTPIFFDMHLFGVRKRGGGQLICLDLEGNEVWNSGADRFGHGPYLIADGLIFAMDNVGRLTLAEATSARYNRLAQYVVFEDGHDAWGPMALAAGRLIVRDMTRMTCLDVAQH